LNILRQYQNQWAMTLVHTKNSNHWAFTAVKADLTNLMTDSQIGSLQIYEHYGLLVRMTLARVRVHIVLRW
jgi:catalase (peroxidase I)